MKTYAVKKIVVLMAAIAALAASTLGGSDNSVVHLKLTAILVCDDSGARSVLKNGKRLQGTSPCQAAGSVPSDTSNSSLAMNPAIAPQSAGSNAAGGAAPANASKGASRDAAGVRTPEGDRLLSFEVGDLQIVIVVLCPGT